MAVWNYYADDQGEITPSIRRNSNGEHWYKMPRVGRDGAHSGNRNSLWESISIARRDNLPMLAMLKDHDTHRCSLDHVFNITDVVYEADGSALWLKLDTKDREVGADVHVMPLEYLADLEQFDPTAELAVLPEDQLRTRKLTAAQYMAACDIAQSVYFGAILRTAGIARLAEEQQVTPGSASALINNYRCLMTGTPIKAPMSADAMEYFTDSILALQGNSALDKIILALDGFIQYAKNKWGNDAAGMRQILSRLQQEFFSAKLADSVSDLVRNIRSDGDEQNTIDDQASELLREIWVRGPQHAAFRRALRRRWNQTCSVHGVACNDHLRASHIVAWRLDEKIRGDVNNGLLLSVPLDSLFDRGLISFNDDGHMLFSRRLAKETYEHFGLRPELRLAWSHLDTDARERIRANLAKHRAAYGMEHGYP